MSCCCLPQFELPGVPLCVFGSISVLSTQLAVLPNSIVPHVHRLPRRPLSRQDGSPAGPILRSPRVSDGGVGWGEGLFWSGLLDFRREAVYGTGTGLQSA